MNFKDIYFSVDNNIVKKGYWQLDNKKRIELVFEELRYYTILKIKEYNLPVNVNNKTWIDLVCEISLTLEKEKCFEILNPYVHYLLNIAGSMQHFSIVWKIEQKNLENLPQVNIDFNNKWESLTTYINADITSILKFVVDILQNYFIKQDLIFLLKRN